MSVLRRLTCAAAIWIAPLTPGAVDLPEPGRCPPYPGSSDAAREPGQVDAVPAELRPGQRIPSTELERLRFYLPPEVWQRRRIFFPEGERLEIGACHRRFLASREFEEATREGAGRARLDSAGNLHGYSGAGLPFAPETIGDREAQAATRWAWSYRYRHLGAGFRGPFRIHHVSRQGKQVSVFEGEIFVQPFRGLPALAVLDARRSLAAGGRFTAPPLARGLAWRQFIPAAADLEADRADDVFVWLPASRRVKRALPHPGEGLFVPDYTHGRTAGSEVFQIPDTASGAGHVDLGQGALEPVRRGFLGLFLRPNSFTWEIERVQDVLSPIDVRSNPGLGSERRFGRSGLSLASERWDLRRAVLLRGVRSSTAGPARELRLYVDAQSLAPLYLITRSKAARVLEVVIFAGRFDADDPPGTPRESADAVRGAILSVVQSAWVSGGTGWLRESFALRSGAPDAAELRDFLTTHRLGLER